MTHNFQVSLSKLERLSAVKLDKASRRIRSEMADAEWKMSVCLLAIKRSGAFRKLGFGTLTDYAERVLRLSGRKVGSLLGAAEALEHLPLMSEAFREGRIGWSKVRVIHGLATPETEGEWLKFAEAHTSTEVERQVALSPRKWKRHRALKASIEGKPAVSSGEVREFLEQSELGGCEVSVDSVVVEESHPNPPSRIVQPRERLESEKTSPPTRENPNPPVERPLPPAAPQTIRVVFELTPDQYALYEQAEIRVRAQEGRRLARAEVLKRMAETVLAQGTAKARARHQVLVYKTEESDEAWYETDRGVLPVAPGVLEEALGGQEVLYLEADGVVLSNDRSSTSAPEVVAEPVSARSASSEPSGADSPKLPGPDTTPPEPNSPRANHSCDSRGKRTAIPNAVIRQVFARAGHRCECCGRKGGRLDVHHREPVSEGGSHELSCLELLCRACHTKNHEADFEEKPHWRAARERARPGRSGDCRNHSGERTTAPMVDCQRRENFEDER